MWPFKRKQPPEPKDVYKITYVLACDVTDVAFVFQKSNLREYYVEAKDAIEAQVQFARLSGVSFSPHICIDRITKVMSGEDRM